MTRLVQTYLYLLADLQYFVNNVYITLLGVGKSPQHQTGVYMPEMKNHTATHGILHNYRENNCRNFMLQQVICSLQWITQVNIQWE